MTALDPVPAAVRPLRPIVPLLTRLVVAQVFLNAGLGKWMDYPGMVEGFRSAGFPVPEVLTGVVATAEVLGGALILLGLFTRFAALLLCGVMVVALATAHRQDVLDALVLQPAAGKGLTTIVAFVMLALLAWLLVYGPGAISLDRLRAARRRRADVREGALAVHDDRHQPGRRHAHREKLEGARPEPAKLEPGRARAEREHMVPSRMLGRPTDEVRGAVTPPETRGPM